MHEVPAGTSCIFASCQNNGFAVILSLPNPIDPFGVRKKRFRFEEFSLIIPGTMSQSVCIYVSQGGEGMDELYLFEHNVTIGFHLCIAGR